MTWVILTLLDPLVPQARNCCTHVPFIAFSQILGPKDTMSPYFNFTVSSWCARVPQSQVACRPARPGCSVRESVIPRTKISEWSQLCNASVLYTHLYMISVVAKSLCWVAGAPSARCHPLIHLGRTPMCCTSALLDLGESSRSGDRNTNSRTRGLTLHGPPVEAKKLPIN